MVRRFAKWKIIASPRSNSSFANAMSNGYNVKTEYFLTKRGADRAATFYSNLFGNYVRFLVVRSDTRLIDASEDTPDVRPPDVDSSS